MPEHQHWRSPRLVDEEADSWCDIERKVGEREIGDPLLLRVPHRAHAGVFDEDCHGANGSTWRQAEIIASEIDAERRRRPSDFGRHTLGFSCIAPGDDDGQLRLEFTERAGGAHTDDARAPDQKNRSFKNSGHWQLLA
jgi:hypothetical protein